jgi:hypothetical protein
MAQDPTCQYAQEQQSRQPSRDVIPNKKYHHDKKLTQKEQRL